MARTCGVTSGLTGMLRRARAIACAAVCLMTAALPQVAYAQRARIAGPAGPSRFDVTIGGGLMTGVSIGEADANIRANATTLQDYTLFSTDTTLRPAPVLDLRVAGAVTRRFALEGQVLLSQPQLETTITSDVESAPDLTVSERITQVLLGGGVRVRLDDVARSGRTTPYVSGGAGVLRQTHEDGATAVRSPVFYVGGGIRHGLGAGSGPARFGIQADVRLLMVKGGLTFDDSRTTQITATGGVFFSF